MKLFTGDLSKEKLELTVRAVRGDRSKNFLQIW